MSQEEDDVLILSEKDLSFQTCCVKTKRGSVCKNRLYNEKYCKLHHKQFGLEKPEECPICMESLENTDRPTQCGHWIHKECLMKWKEDTCPMCRTPIKFTVEEKRIKRRLHKKECASKDDVILPPQILELIESLLRGVPEYMREEFVAGFLQIDVGGNSILLGDSGVEDEYEEFSASDIEDFPDISEI